MEIRKYIEDLTKSFELEKRVLVRSHIIKLEWNEEHNAWNTEMTVRHGSEGKEERHICIRAEFVTLASGVFPYPKVPKVSGLADFKGNMFHTSRWDYDVTGGSSDTVFPDMDKLSGKRVGIIGTGATAVQLVPQLVKYAKELYVFQRVPSQILARNQCDTDPKEWREAIASTPG